MAITRNYIGSQEDVEKAVEALNRFVNANLVAVIDDYEIKIPLYDRDLWTPGNDTKPGGGIPTINDNPLSEMAKVLIRPMAVITFEFSPGIDSRQTDRIFELLDRHPVYAKLKALKVKEAYAGFAVSNYQISFKYSFDDAEVIKKIPELLPKRAITVSVDKRTALENIKTKVDNKEWNVEGTSIFGSTPRNIENLRGQLKNLNANTPEDEIEKLYGPVAKMITDIKLEPDDAYKGKKKPARSQKVNGLYKELKAELELVTSKPTVYKTPGIK